MKYSDTILLAALLVLGCRAKLDPSGGYSDSQALLTAVDKAENECSNRFEQFFDKFKADSQYQASHIENPLLITTIGNDEIPENRRENITYIGFNDADWDGSVILTSRVISPDSTVVLLELEDTGTYIEHIFVCRGSSWNLVQLVDSSN